MAEQNTGGKGCKPRPFSISQEEYDNRWDMIFQRDLPKENDKPIDESDTKQNQSDNH